MSPVMKIKTRERQELALASSLTAGWFGGAVSPLNGVGGAVSPLNGVGGGAPENFFIFGLFLSHLEAIWAI